MWSHLLIIITSLLCLFIIYKKFTETPSDVRIAVYLLMSITGLQQTIKVLEIPYYEFIVGFLHMFILATALSTLLITIRHLKSDVYRYPYPFVFAPVLIIIFYPLLFDITVLERFILFFLEASCLLVLLMLFISYLELFKRPVVAIAGISLLIMAFILYWTLPETYTVMNYIWPISLALGMMLTAYSYQSLFIDDRSKSSTTGIIWA